MSVHKRGWWLDPVELRRAAERQLRGRLQDDSETSVMQMELELQHEELQRAYHELDDSHGRFRELFDCAPVAFLETDRTHRIVRANEAARALFGRVEGTLVTKIASRGAADGLLSTLTGSTQQRTRASADHRLLGAWGEIVARVTTRRLRGERSLIAIEDVTARRQTQATLEASERRLRDLITKAPDAIGVLRDDVFVLTNQALTKLLAAPGTTLVGERFSSFLVGETDLADSDNDLVELRLRAQSGAEQVVECRRMRIDFDGEASQLLMMRDLTERRRMESRVDRAERLATVGMLVAGVAHEINNPLSYVLTNLELALRELEGGGTPADLRELAAEALEGARRIAAITDDLRSLQTTDERVEAVAVNDVVRRVIRMARPKVASHATIRCDAGVVPDIPANSGRLSQVILNLILNAAHAMPDRSPDLNLIAIRTWATAADVCVLVEDNGSGIAPKNVARLFDPFFTTRKHSGGTGLGLAISNSIVQQLGGFIAVESSLGSGSRFVVHLPVIGAPLSHPPPPRPPRREGSPHGPRRSLQVLVIDDEVAVAKALRRALRHLGEVESVSSARVAMDLLQRNASYDVILCDLVMPSGSGVELARWLERHHPTLLQRLVLMSGLPQPSLKGYDRVPFLVKPFDLRQVEATIVAVAEAESADAEPPSDSAARLRKP